MTAMYKEYPYRSQSGESPSGIDGRRLAERVVAEVKSIEGVRDVCDIGCGNGYLTFRLAESGFRTLGIDASVSGIEAARAVYGEYSEFACIDVSSDDKVKQLSKQAYDAVIASEVIEHLYRPSDLIETATTVLRPGGTLLVTTPYHGYLKYLAMSIVNKMDRHLNPLWDGGHIKFFSVRTLSSLIASHGLDVVKFTYYGRVPLLWKSMICIAKHKRDTSSMDSVLDSNCRRNTTQVTI